MSPWGLGNSSRIGRCSCCGGDVTLPSAWWSVVPPVATCEQCGATEDRGGPVIPTTPPHHMTTSNTITLDHEGRVK